MKLEANGDDHIANVLNMVKTQSLLVEDYLSGRISKDDEKEEDSGKDAADKGANKVKREMERESVCVYVCV